jgi:hypothetical protein
MNRVLSALAFLALAAAGCSSPRAVRTFIGRPAPECRSLGEVRGFRGQPVRANEAAGRNQVVAAAERAGADAIRFRSAVDEEYRGIAYVCGDARIRGVRVVASRFLKEEPPPTCEEIGVVESTLAANQAELREILTSSAAGMGGNVMRFDSSGTRRVGERDAVTGVGTAFFCPDL